jgi:4-hydroxybenzoate polyprenyltransferase
MALDTGKFTLPTPAWLQTLRYNEWWRFKVPFLLGIYFWQIEFATIPMDVFWLNAALLVVWMFGAAGFGYFVNDCFDIDQDAAASKPNRSGSLSVASRWLVATSLLAIALLPWYWLPTATASWLLVGIHLLSFLLYSIPPIRLKERYYLGAITDALYSYFLPVLLVAYTAWLLNNLPPNYFVPSPHQALALAGWSLAAGLRNIIQHHILDRRKDRISGTANIINRYGLRFNVNLLRGLFIPLEIVLFAFAVYFTGNYTALLYSLLGFFCLWQLLPVVRINLRQPLNLRLDLGLFTLNTFYEIYLPFGFLIAFAIAQPWYWATILPYHFLFPNPLISFTLWILALVFHHLVLRWLWIVRLILSRIVNYSIHYTRVAYRYARGIKPYDPREQHDA